MKHYKPIKCVVCSKIFTPAAANQNTCCEAHRQQRATELRKIREKKRLKRKPVKKNKLAEICEIAKSKGMSYGQYMAEQYKKEVMIKSMNVVEIANIINTRIYRKVGYAVTKIANM